MHFLSGNVVTRVLLLFPAVHAWVGLRQFSALAPRKFGSGSMGFSFIRIHKGYSSILLKSNLLARKMH